MGQEVTREELQAELKKTKIHLADTLQQVEELKAALHQACDEGMPSQLAQPALQTPASGPSIQLIQDNDLKHVSRGWAIGAFAYEIHHGFEMDHTYNYNTMRMRAQAMVNHAFEPTRLGPNDRVSGDPDMSKLPTFDRSNKLCVKVWIEGK